MRHALLRVGVPYAVDRSELQQQGTGNIQKDFITHVIGMQKQTSALPVRG